MKPPFRVWKDVYAIGGPELTDPNDCCVYLLGGQRPVVIDSGIGGSFDQLVANIREVGINPEKVHAVIVTHAHIDHIGSLRRFHDELGAAIVAHEPDAAAIESGEDVGADLYGISYRRCHVDITLESAEDDFAWSGGTLKIVHVPGHTPGSVVVYVDLGKRVLFGQDIHGPYNPAWGADPARAIASLQKLIDLKADILCEGHFGVYQPAGKVTSYIKSVLDNLQNRDREEA